jgi:hypothetical protein
MLSFPFVDTDYVIDMNRNAQMFQKCRSHLKILRARYVTWSILHTEDPKLLGLTVKKYSPWPLYRGLWYCIDIRYICVLQVCVNVHVLHLCYRTVAVRNKCLFLCYAAINLLTYQTLSVSRCDNVTNFLCWLSWNLGASTSWNTLGLSRPV